MSLSRCCVCLARAIILIPFVLAAATAPAQEAPRQDPQIAVNPASLTLTEPGLRVWTPDSPDSRAAEDGAQDYVPGRLIVRYAEGVAVRPEAMATSRPALDALAHENGVIAMRQLFAPSTLNAGRLDAAGLDRVFVLDFSGPRDARDLARTFEAMPGVDYAEPDYLLELDHADPPQDAPGRTSPNDPLYPSQWGLNNTGQAVSNTGGLVGTPGSDINVGPAWQISTGTPSVIIAILDTGVDLTHQEFAGRLAPGYDFIANDNDPSPKHGSAHGTAAAGIAAAAGNNAEGVAGVSWSTQIMPLRVCGSSGCPWTATSSAMIWAADEGASVISMSLGGPTFSQLMEDAVNYAYDAGLVVLASTGNENTSSPRFPASYANSISVGALSPCNTRKTPSSCDGETWWGSSFGAGMDFLAPGTRIHTTDITGAGGYTSGDYTPTFNGTSAACPFAAGVVGLLLSANPTLTPDEVRSIMQTTAVDMGSPGYNDDTGFGRLNAGGAVAMAGAGGSGVFSVSNVGGGSLEVSSITTDRVWLTVSPTGPFALGEGAGESVVVIVDWGQIDEPDSATITIASNDAASPTVVIPVAVLPVQEPPEAVFTPSLAIGLQASLDPGGTTTRIINIANVGEMELEFEFPLFSSAVARELANPANPLAHLSSSDFPATARGAETDHPTHTPARGEGGPDAFGYVWIDSDEDGGPSFEDLDISATGTARSMVQAPGCSFSAQDEGFALVELPFTFPFYGQGHDQVWVSANGFVAFQAVAGCTYSIGQLPSPTSPNSAAPGAMIAPLWADLDGGLATSDIHTELLADGRFVIQWTNWPRYNQSSPNTFQVILYPNGASKVQYLDLQGSLANATRVGQQNHSGSDGLLIASGSGYPAGGKAVLVVPPVSFVTAVSPASGTVPSGGSVDVVVTFDATDVDDGTHEGTITISTNEQGVGSHSYPVTLHVSPLDPPEAHVSPGSLDLEVAWGQTTDEVLVLSNMAGVGAASLDYTAAVVSAPGRTGGGGPPSVEISPAAGSVDAQDSDELLVTVDASGAAPGTYDFEVVIESNDPVNPLLVVAVSVEVGEGDGEVTVPVSVASGWNLISVPILAQDMSAWTLFPGASSDFFAFDDGYAQAEALDVGAGYWAKFDDAAVFDVTGLPADPQVVSVAAGWNLIGFFETSVPLEHLATDPEGIVGSDFFGFDFGYQISTALEPGYGYWVKVDAPGTLFVDAAARGVAEHAMDVPSSAAPWAGSPALEGSARLTIGDAAGRMVELYLVEDDGSGSGFVLPPLPPAGAFDARFSDDRYAAAVSAGSWEALLSGAVYPVTIALEGLGAGLHLADGITGTLLDVELPDGGQIRLDTPLTSIRMAYAADGAEPAQPLEYGLEAAYPNPSATATTFRYSLPETQPVRLAVYDLLGRLVTRLVDDEVSAGLHEVVFQTHGLASGTYVYRLEAGPYAATRRFTVAR